MDVDDSACCCVGRGLAQIELVPFVSSAFCKARRGKEKSDYGRLDLTRVPNVRNQRR